MNEEPRFEADYSDRQTTFLGTMDNANSVTYGPESSASNHPFTVSIAAGVLAWIALA